MFYFACFYNFNHAAKTPSIISFELILNSSASLVSNIYANQISPYHISYNISFSYYLDDDEQQIHHVEINGIVFE